MPYRLHPVNSVSITQAPSPCVECVFWQTRPHRSREKAKWAAPAEYFSRAQHLPAGPPTPDAVLITCAYLVDVSSPWVVQSLFLSVIAEARDRGMKAIETFGYRYPEGESGYERFFVHRTIFPTDFLADFGFYPVRWEGQVALARLELGGLQPVLEGRREAVLRKVKEAFVPAPVPERPY